MLKELVISQNGQTSRLKSLLKPLMMHFSTKNKKLFQIRLKILTDLSKSKLKVW